MLCKESFLFTLEFPHKENTSKTALQVPFYWERCAEDKTCYNQKIWEKEATKIKSNYVKFYIQC